MPYKPAKPCKEPGCPNLTNDYLGFCPEHKKKHQRVYDNTRPSASARGYDDRWRKERRAYLRQHPLCVECLKEGKRRAATIVDHIKPHRGDKKLFWNKKNWQGLCKTHHDKKTARERAKESKGG